MKYRKGDVVRRWSIQLDAYEIGVVKCTWIGLNHKTIWYKIAFQNKDDVVDVRWHSEMFLTPIEKKSKEDLM